ncbi:MAG TPA: NAD(P)/FAD-dependent oxidoreductase [Chryseosolibacter sp.]
MEKSRSEQFDLIVVGGGAAGFYAAVRAAERSRGLKVLILEKSNKVLAKVKISGGGRCNVTHDCPEPFKLARHYPRGEKSLKTVFKIHDAKNTIEWFEKNGVQLKVEEDGRMFPVTDDSQTIIDCLMRQAMAQKIKIQLGEAVISVSQAQNLFTVTTQSGKIYDSTFLVIATGGNPSPKFYEWIGRLGHTIVPPIPSLFTFNDSEEKFKDLMGVSVPNGEVKIAGTKLSQQGPVLVTHWGLSGPAVIKLSAWAAEYLHQHSYEFTALVSWIGSAVESVVQNQLAEFKLLRGKQKIYTNPQFGIPQRLWSRLCDLAQIEENRIWAELPQKNLNKLMEFLIRCPFKIKGKTTFKEEFVTCGGVDLKEIDLERMESKLIKNLFFAGEVLNIDGETGGFNFQAAWSTGFVASKSITMKYAMEVQNSQR